jgi:hypothetical protein
LLFLVTVTSDDDFRSDFRGVLTIIRQNCISICVKLFNVVLDLTHNL